MLNRTDTKFIFNSDLLPQLIAKIKDDYNILQVNNHRFFTYSNVYFDTPDLNLYRLHHNGKLNRYKVRSRSYVETGLNFLEVKFKNNKGRTIKSRLRTKELVGKLEGEYLDFVQDNISFDAGTLKPSLNLQFKRFTLAEKNFKERITIDQNLSFQANNRESSLPKLIVVEVKQAKFDSSAKIVRAFRDLRIKRLSVSKYCLGILQTYPTVKQNRFKMKFNPLKKIDSNYALAV